MFQFDLPLFQIQAHNTDVDCAIFVKIVMNIVAFEDCILTRSKPLSSIVHIRITDLRNV
jgi:hypothetical protein